MTVKTENNILERQKSIIASIILNRANYYTVKDKVAPMMFSGILGDIAAFIWERLSEQKVFDTASLKARFDSGIINELIQSSTGRSMLEEHAQVLYDNFMASKLEEITGQVVRSVQAGGSFSEAHSQAEAELEMIRALFATAPPRIEIFNNVLNEVLEAQERKGINGVPSGWQGFDKYTSGFQKGTLYGIMARPGMGKTTNMCCMAEYQVQHGYTVAIFSMGDIPKAKVIKKIISIRTGLSFSDIISGNLSEREFELFEQANNELYESNLHVFDVQDVKTKKVFDIADKIRDLDRQGQKPDIVYVDYIQQLKPQNSKLESNPPAKLEEISGNLQYICGLLNIPLVEYMQLSRDVEKRQGPKRPQLSDARWSGAIEQDVRMMFAIYRPEYYDITEDEQGRSTAGYTEFYCLKNDVQDKLASFDLYWHKNKLVEEQDVDFDAPIPSASSNLITARADTGDDDIPF